MQARTLPVPHPQPNAATVADVRVELRLDPDGELSIAWHMTPGDRSRPISPELATHLGALAKATAEAESRHDLAVIGASRRELGRALFDLLDGPERALSRRLDQAALDGSCLALTVALRGRGVVAQHPAATWRWELIADEHGPLMLRRELTLAVQLGETHSSEPRALAHGGLRILFMAYSPRDIEPQLDYEGEEEHVLAALSPFIEDGRAQVVVVEFGTLEGLRQALLGREFDVVHLSGHGMLGAAGPQLLMEDQFGDVDRVTPARLLAALERAGKMPELVMVSSCLSAGERDDIPSLTTQLVAGGVPAAVGWIQPIRDDLATEAASDIYQRLCNGATPAQAVAFARVRLHAADLAGSPKQAANAWGTLHLVTRNAAGFFVDRHRPRPSAEPGDHRETYRYLGEQGRMRVLETGFVGRRRPLQRVLRVLLTGVEGGLSRAGAIIFGNKGTGKSCLAARAIERIAGGLEDRRELGVIVLHGEIDDALLFQRCTEQAQRWEDDKAEALLGDSGRGTIIERLRRLLSSQWARRRLVFLLDDFEQNLDIQGEGLARLSPYAAALLELLLPACLTAKAKLLITTTARFELPSAEAEREPLVEVRLRGFDPSSLRKLWMRGQTGEAGTDGELIGFGPSDWIALCNRLGRNPRILDWARTLLRGKSSKEFDSIVEKAGAAVPKWEAGEPPSTEQQDELARLFLCHMSYHEAVTRISDDARTFVRRARVYELPVPREGLEGLCEGLAINLDLHVPALQNLGLLEAGELDYEPASRVSTLVEPEFAAEGEERWHGVAAAFWGREERHRGRLDRMTMAWEHALAGCCEDLAAAISLPLRQILDGTGLLQDNLNYAKRHTATFPDAESGLTWVAWAHLRTGNPVAAWSAFEKAETLAIERNASASEMCRIHHEGARILEELGRLDEAAHRLGRAITIAEGMGHGSTESYAILLHDLAGVLNAQGNLSRALELLERSLEIKAEVYGKQEHPEVAVSHSELAGVLIREGERTKDSGILARARKHLDLALRIQRQVYGTDIHPSVAHSHHQIAWALIAEGDLLGARQHVDECLSIYAAIHGTDEHPSVARTLHNLATILAQGGYVDDAIKACRRALQIERKCYGTQDHYLSAETELQLAILLLDSGEVDEAALLLDHVETVLTRQVPGHPTLPQIAQVRRMFGLSPDQPALPNPSRLAHVALQARSGVSLGELDRQLLEAGLDALTTAGPPFDTLAVYLHTIKNGSVLLSIPDYLPPPVAEFLESVREAAQSIDDQR